MTKKEIDVASDVEVSTVHMTIVAAVDDDGNPAEIML